MSSSKFGFFFFIFLLFGALCFGQTTYTHQEVAEEFTVPSSSIWEYTFVLKGGDGGYAEISDCFANSASGARNTFKVVVGPNPGQIPHGSTIRVIVGAAGTAEQVTFGTGSVRGGGGGGTAVLADIDNEWVILGVAGGGSGAYQGAFLGGCVDSNPGQGGRTGSSGGDGGGTFGGAGGSNGQGGELGGGPSNSGGGGGAFGDGENSGLGGKKGYPSGGAGGDDGGTPGGWGFGGGGSGYSGGGGGGGYSGGGGGSDLDNGGGGGSYVNHEYVYNEDVSLVSSSSSNDDGEVTVSSTEICAAIISGFDYINPLCTDADQGRIQFNHSFNSGAICNAQLEWTLTPLNGWQYLGDGVFRSMRAGEYTLHISNTEAAGQVVTAYSFTIAPTTEAPQARCKNLTVTLENGEYSNANFHNLINNGSTGICDEPLTLSASQNNFDCNDLGVTLVTLTVLGHNGVSATCGATITVKLNDNDLPVASCQPDFSIDLAGNGSINLPVSTINNNSYATACEESISISHPELTCLNAEESVAVTLTVQDQGGRTDQCITTVTVVDTGTPTAVCKDVFTQILDVSGNAILNPSDLNLVSTSNNCTSLIYSANIVNFDCNDIGSNDVILTVTDGYGRSNSCQTVVEIAEITSPVAVCQDITVSVDENGSYTLDPSELDNGSSAGCTTCDAGCTPSLSSSITNFDCDDLGEHLVTLTVTSAPNVTVNCQATVTVIDDVPPTANCLQYTVILHGGVAGIGIFRTPFAQQATDNCGLSSVGFLGDGILTCEDLGIGEVLWEVADASGNRDTCTAMFIVVEDLRDPVANCLENYTVELDDTGGYSLSSSDLQLILDNSIVFTSECLGPIGLDTLASQSIFDCDDLGTSISIDFTISQEGLPSSSCTSTITVLDDVSPICQTAVAQLELKVMLSGPYDPVSGLMNDQLRAQGLIPLVSPYPGTDATTTAGVLSTTGSNAIVDWVLIELRDDQDSGAVLHTRAALLQRDGDIVDVDGISPVRFPETENGDYYVTVRHRNHLGIMMDTPVEIIKSIPQD